MIHAHMEVDLRGGEFGGDFCLPRAGRWRVDQFKQTLVIGKGVPRVEIPLVNINAMRLTDAQWCRYTPPTPEESERVDLYSWDKEEPIASIPVYRVEVDEGSFSMGSRDKPVIIDADPRWRVLREIDPDEYDHLHVNGECVKDRWGTCEIAAKVDDDQEPVEDDEEFEDPDDRDPDQWDPYFDDRSSGAGGM